MICPKCNNDMNYDVDDELYFCSFCFDSYVESLRCGQVSFDDLVKWHFLDQTEVLTEESLRIDFEKIFSKETYSSDVIKNMFEAYKKGRLHGKLVYF